MMKQSLNQVLGNTTESESTDENFGSIWNIGDGFVGVASEKGSVSQLIGNDPIQGASRSQHDPRLNKGLTEKLMVQLAFANQKPKTAFASSTSGGHQCLHETDGHFFS